LHIREILFHKTELEGKKVSGQIEIDKAYFGGCRRNNIGQRAWSKSVVFGFLKPDNAGSYGGDNQIPY
jgi:hypothetical protein